MEASAIWRFSFCIFYLVYLVALSLMFRSAHQAAVSGSLTPATGRYSSLDVAVSWPAHFCHFTK